jgi:hypothetical protein
MLYVYHIPEQGGWVVLEGGGICAIKVGGPFNTQQQAVNYLNNRVMEQLGWPKAKKSV